VAQPPRNSPALRSHLHALKILTMNAPPIPVDLKISAVDQRNASSSAVAATLPMPGITCE